MRASSRVWKMPNPSPWISRTAISTSLTRASDRSSGSPQREAPTISPPSSRTSAETGSPGRTLGGAAENQLAVDNALGSPFEGDLYVTTNGGAVKLFAPSGEEIGGITGFGEACGVAVDQSTGDVYVGDYGNAIWRFEPISNTTPVTNASYVKTGVQPQGLFACQVGTDTSGHAYGMNWSSGPLQVFNASDFSASPPSVLGTELNGVPSNTVYTDPQTDELYVDEGNKIGIFDPTGTRIQTFGSGASRNRAGSPSMEPPSMSTHRPVPRSSSSAPNRLRICRSTTPPCFTPLSQPTPTPTATFRRRPMVDSRPLARCSLLPDMTMMATMRCSATPLMSAL